LPWSHNLRYFLSGLIYSNLHWLFYNVQDFSNALVMAQKEYVLSERLHDLAASDAMYVGATLMQLDSTRSVERYFEKAFEMADDSETNVALLCQFSSIGRKDLAKECYERIKILPKSVKVCLSLGTYFQSQNVVDTATYYF